jgi:LPXTG-site transpeptidase (sortase) family protein
MRRPWNGAMPMMLTLPVGLHRRPLRRQRRLRRFAIAALLALGLALLAAGFWLPAKAELAPQLVAPALLDGSAAPGSHGVTVIAGHRDTHFRPLATLALGDELTLERPDGAVLRYEVAALDVVDSTRTEIRLDADESIVVLVTCWPFEAVDVGGSWRYVVTARQRF